VSLESDLEDARRPIAARTLTSALVLRINSAQTHMGRTGALRRDARGSTGVPRRSPTQVRPGQHAAATYQTETQSPNFVIVPADPRLKTEQRR